MSTTKKADRAKKPSYESTLKTLEKYVGQMEDNETSLEDSLELFEKGISLIRLAQEQLMAAEQKVTRLEEENGKPQSTPFQADSNKQTP